jgi:hypothetical protein
MRHTEPCRQIVICGHPISFAARLATLLHDAAETPVTVNLRASALAIAVTPESTAITCEPSDVRAAKLILQDPVRAAQSCFVLVMRDPRDMLIERDAENVFTQGSDHLLHVAENGIRTLSEPGLLFTQAIMESVHKRAPRAIMLRQEDMETRPDLAQRALSAVSGIAFRRPFAELIAANSDWDNLRGRMGDEVPALDPDEAERLVRQFRLAPELFAILERWGYTRAGQRHWFDALAARAPGGCDDSPGTIVGFYTAGDRYEIEARRLEASVQALGLPLRLERVEPTPDWLGAVRRKPAILRDLRERLRGPLLYVDVDAVVHRDPWPYLRGYRADVAVSGHRDAAIISGTILINDTPGALAMIDAWIAAQDADPAAWDQHALQTVVLDHSEGGAAFRVDYLPPEMCRVFDRRYNPPIEAVIEHLQASREQGAGSEDASTLDRLARRRTRIDEIEATLADTAARSFADLPAEHRRLATLELAAARATDTTRWADPRNLKANWSPRARLVGQLLRSGDTVLDIGCGNMDLAAEIPLEARYIPADVVPRDDRTLLCDLNAGRLPDCAADVVTMLGVLEYCHDPIAVLAAIAQRWRRLVLTYNPSDLDAGRDRRIHGWFNDLTSADLVGCACAQGYQLEAVVPHGARERIYAFGMATA